MSLVFLKVMELQQCFSVSMNEYEESEGVAKEEETTVKTEDIYQSLQYPSADCRVINRTPKASERCERNYVFLLFAVNILISVIILAIVGLNYSHNKETQPIKGQKEVWHLHDDVFYLFWSADSDCRAAQSFCSKRNTSLAKLSVGNKGWLMSRTKGKQFLVSRVSSEGSGEIFSQFKDDEDDCGIVTSAVATDHGEGFVCERRVNPQNCPQYIEDWLS